MRFFLLSITFGLYVSFSSIAFSSEPQAIYSKLKSTPTVQLFFEKHQATIIAKNQTTEKDELALSFKHYKEGNHQLNLGQFDLAVANYTEAIRLNPQNFKAYCNRGVAYFRLGKFNLAIQDQNSAINLKPSEFAYNNRGEAKMKLHQNESAILDFDKAIELNPRCATCYCNRGAVYSTIGEKFQAIDDFGIAIKLNTSYSDAYYLRGREYTRMRLIDLATDSQELQYYQLQDKSYEYEKHLLGIKDLDKAIQLNPFDSEAYLVRGLANYRIKETKQAISDFNKVLELDPKNIKAKDYLLRLNK